MITPDHMNTLEVAAQDVLHQKPFDGIRQSIDEVAIAAADDELGRLRVRKLPLGGAFVHAVGSRVIETIEEGAHVESFGGTGLAVYDRYLMLTRGIEQTAGQEVIAELKDTEGTFKNAFTYFDHQIAILGKSVREDAEQHNRLGKVAKEKLPTSQTLLSGLLARNTEDVSTPILLQQAMRLCRTRGSLPSGEELGEHLRAMHATISGWTHAPGQVLHRILLGKELAQERFRRVRYENNPEPSMTAWPKIFRRCLETGGRPALTEEMAPSLQEHPSSSFRLFGYCAAQLRLQSPDHPQRPGAASAAAASFFARQGFALQDGSFKLTDYQILRDIEVAEQTIFADSDCRSALELLARDNP